MIQEQFRTRYKAPKLHHFLPRQRLLSVLEDRNDRKVFLIVGKAGQGKSSLSADFLDRNHLQYTWLNLSEEEKDPRLLLQRFREALTRYPTEKPNSQGEEPSLDALLRQLSGLKTHDYYIVLDNYQTVNPSRDAGELLEQLIAALPENLHLIILSREYPRFSTAKLRIERNLVELNDSDLSFTEDEIHTLLHSLCQIDLSRAQVEGIAEASGGWTAALICLAELLDSKTVPDQNHLIETFVEQRKLDALDLFIEEEIFNPLSTGEKTLLTRLAGYTSIQAVLVTRLIGEEGVAVLENLIERNVLLKWVDESLSIFSIHPLFSTFLVGRFQALPSKEKDELHRRAALYFQDYGDHARAIHHFILCREYDKAKEIFQKIAEESLEQHHYERIHELLVAFPEDFRNQSPILLYYYAITTNLIQPSLSRKTLRKLLAVFRDQGDINREARIYSVLLANYIFYQGNREAVEELVELSRSFVDRIGSELDSDRKEVLATLISLGRWWTKPELDNAFEIALRAEETSHRIKDQEILILANLVLARIHLDRGEFQQAKDLLQKTEKLLDQNPAYRHYDALLRFYLGDTYFYLGEIRQAIDQTNRGLVQNPGVAFCQYLKLNLILDILYLPETKSAESMLEELGNEDIGENLFVRYYSMYLLKMLHAYRKDNRQRAEYYCKNLQEPENQKLLQTDYPYSTTDLAEVLFFLGQTDAAMQRLQELLIDDFREKYPYTYATAVALLGYIYHELNQKKESERLFADLVEVITQKGYRNLDTCDVHLLERIAEASGLPQFKEFPRLKKAKTELGTTPAGAAFFIQALGDFKIILRGETIPASTLSRQKKVLDLLKLLLVHRQNGILKETLYDLFWPGYLPKSCRDNLNTLIYRLRKILGEAEDYVLTQGGIIRLNDEICTVDVDHFLQQIKEGEQAQRQNDRSLAMACYNKAKDLYQGDFLEKDLYYDDIRDYRETLKNEYLQLLFNITIMNLDAGIYQVALGAVKALIRKDPLCETAYRLLMIASTLVGNRSEVPRVVDKLNKALQHYYNIEADPKTIALKEKLLEGQIPEASMWRSETLI